MNRIRQISNLGQAIWLDFISRKLIQTHELRSLVNEGVTGLTSNPTIFHKSIIGGEGYDDQIRELSNSRAGASEIYEALVIRDIGEAADQIRPVYNETHARDGYVSLEVSPELAHDTEKTIAEAQRLFRAVNRPNLMIKVPATPEGIPAIQRLISEGINVNITLIFSIDVYEKVMRAYIDGLRALHEAGRPIGLVGSVASFFVSRVDTMIDEQLTRRIEQGEKGLESLRGQAAIANAKIAYARFQEVFEGPDFAALRAAGARVQRPLWASTSTKNPAYPDTMYVDALIGPHTVNTVPPATLQAIRERATVARTIDLDVDEAYGVMEKLQTVGVDMKKVTDALITAGVKSFADSFEQLMADIEKQRARYRGGRTS